MSTCYATKPRPADLPGCHLSKGGAHYCGRPGHHNQTGKPHRCDCGHEWNDQ